MRYTPDGADRDAVFDAKVIYPGGYDEIDVTRVPKLFRPQSGALNLTDWEKVFAAGPTRWNAVDVFAERGLSRDGVVVVSGPTSTSRPCCRSRRPTSSRRFSRGGWCRRASSCA